MIDRQQRRRAGQEHRPRADAVHRRRGHGHPERDAEEHGGGEQAHRGAAQRGHHLRGMGLQGAVQRVEAQARHQAGRQRQRPVLAECERQPAQAQRDAAAQHQPAFAEHRQQPARREGVEEAARAIERHHARRAREPEAVFAHQEGRQEGQAREGEGALGHHHQQHPARPGLGQHAQDVAQMPMAVTGGRAHRLGAHLAVEADRSRPAVAMGAAAVFCPAPSAAIRPQRRTGTTRRFAGRSTACRT